MATRSHIFVEHNEGLYTGTYCHYDGGPGNKAPALLRLSYDSVYAIVVTATAKGMIRNFNVLENGPELWYSEVEYFSDTDKEYLTNPYCIENNKHVDYLYIKRKDGSVEFCNAYAIEEEWTKVSSLEEYFEKI